MKINVEVVGQIIKGELIPINTKGCETIEVEHNMITVLSENKHTRLIGLDKNLYKMTLKSFKNVKKELNKNNLMYRISVA